METIKLRVSGSQIEVAERPAVITAGTVGLVAEFAFDSHWDALTKTAVFKAGDKVITTLLQNDSHIVPWEVLETPKQWLCIGVYGANRDGTVVMPTLWAEVAVVHTAVDPTGDPATEPTIPVWQEMLSLTEAGVAAERELRAGVDALAQELNLPDDSPDLGAVFSELLALNGANVYNLNDHTDNRGNPHNVTCKQIGALTMDHLIDINTRLQIVDDMAHNNAVDIAIHANTEDNPNPHEITCEKIGAVTKEQHDADIERAINQAYEWSKEYADEEISLRIDPIFDRVYTKTEVDAALAESKAIIVTVNGSTPSHTSQDIYAAIQAGKVVYLHLWGNTYIICSACTESEAKFENSVVISITGADGEVYSAQNFRLYFIKGEKYSANATAIPNQDYIDAQIAYYLNQ